MEIQDLHSVNFLDSHSDLVAAQNEKVFIMRNQTVAQISNAILSSINPLITLARQFAATILQNRKNAASIVDQLLSGAEKISSISSVVSSCYLAYIKYQEASIQNKIANSTHLMDFSKEASRENIDNNRKSSDLEERISNSILNNID